MAFKKKEDVRAEEALKAAIADAPVKKEETSDKPKAAPKKAAPKPVEKKEPAPAQAEKKPVKNDDDDIFGGYEKNAVLPKDVKNKGNKIYTESCMVALNRPTGVTFEMPDGRTVTIEGNGQGLVGKDQGVLPIGAYGLTLVDKEDWRWIYNNFKSLPLIKNGLLFARKGKYEAIEEAEERKELRNGFEPVDVDNTATKAVKES